MTVFSRRRRDEAAAAALLIALGAVSLLFGLGYRIGTLREMDAGFVPVVLGALLMGLGVTLGLFAPRETGGPPGEASPHGRGAAIDWRVWGCVLGSVLAFIVLGEAGGMVPATFGSVFVAALGDRRNTPKQAAVLGLVMVVAGVLVFHVGLALQMPLLRGL